MFQDFVFSNFTAVRLKSLILLTLVIGMVSETVFIIRDEQSSVIEKFEYLTERLDGVKLVSEDKNNHIRLFGGDPIYSTVSSSLSVTRFLDQNALSEFSVGLTSVKSLYLLIRGAGELDATISMPSELIIQYGYVPGFVMSFAILAIARYLAASLMKSNQIFYFAFGYSIVTQILQLERSIQGVFINSIKAAAIVIIISCASLKLVGFKRAIADFGRRQ